MLVTGRVAPGHGRVNPREPLGPGSLNQLHQEATSHTTSFHLWADLVRRLGGIMVGE